MEQHLKLIGYLLNILALVHIIFPRYFKWEQELAQLSLINRQLMYVHTFFIALVVCFMGLLCLFQAQALVSTPLGAYICAGFFGFWFLRLLIQFFGYSSKLWYGKTFETLVHIAFTFLWIYLSFIFGFIAYQGLFSNSAYTQALGF
ncbi:MAG: hypothetical protein EAZ57_01890 [Cytophagales bacterium]|nr:MAG: hypothetical protein EAZ67_02700 [Cytophagales bacterium]TAF61875.1 MAG: hypothetical protein EAZ57_01890 [Cytophagales bacterium]